MKSIKTTGTLLFLLIYISLAAVAKDKSEWKTGSLVSITDSRSNRVINNPTGGVQTVEDVEYRISVLFDGMIYVGSYWPRWKWSYAPTDFVVNDPIEISIDGKEMYIKRPVNSEIKTKVIQRIRQDDHLKAQPPSPKQQHSLRIEVVTVVKSAWIFS
jgi:exosome complex RNA-binding protein Rrp4